MLQSHVVEVGGTFVGAAITTRTALRFVSVHVRVDQLDESTWPSMDELNKAVRHLFLTGQLSPTWRPIVFNPRRSADSAVLRPAVTA